MKQPTMDDLVKAHDLPFELFISEAQIEKRVRELGKAIEADYKGKKPLLLGVLNGAFVFAADLIRASEIDCEISFIKLSSYRGLQSSGEVETLIGLDIDVNGRDIIIVEDILDSGKTLHYFLPELIKLQPASVALAIFLVKPEALEYPIHIDYQGFEIPNKFVIGYGLDYDGLGRNLRGIYQLVTDD